jgi:hypothetical protein
MKQYIYFILLFSVLFFTFPVSAQKAIYPISELGSCRDAKECFFYCQIPEHKPACWSYGTYNMPQVLGESTENVEAKVEADVKAAGVTFPIAQLGNCANTTECHTYCAQPANQQACAEFARHKGLGKYKQEKEKIDKAKIELGCDSIASCISYCQNPDNVTKCRAFAQKYASQDVKVVEQKQQELVQKAKETLGCTSVDSCKTFCEDINNKEKCRAFAKANLEEIPQAQKAKEEIIKKAKEVLPCNSVETCKTYCDNVANRDTCTEFARKVVPTAVKEYLIPTIKATLNCTSVDECRKLCELPENKEKCQQFTQLLKPVVKQESKQQLKITCKTVEECKLVCQKYPDQCPGYKEAEEQRRKQEAERKKQLEELRRQKLELQKNVTPFPTKVFQEVTKLPTPTEVIVTSPTTKPTIVEVPLP